MIALSPTRAERPTNGDLALAVGLLGVAVLSGFYIDVNRPDTIEPSSWWHWGLIATPPILVAFRRMNPALIAVIATVVQSAIWVTNLPEVLLSIIVILYAAASDASRRSLLVAVAASAALTVVTAVGVGIAEDVTLYQLPLIALTCGTAVVLGVNAARQRSLASELAAAVTETRLVSAHERAQAVAEERSHIARELHDIIGHTLSVIAVRAEAADRVAQRHPEAAGEAVTAIADEARTALDQTRRVLAGLRHSAAAELAPPPDLRATVGLVSDLANAGVAATITEEGCDGFAPPAVVAGGAYRIVQEALTNAIKHGGSDVVIEVRLACRDHELDLRIVNTLQRPIEPSQETGAGLTGMAERAEVLGGTFRSERTDTQFVVHATLPTAAVNSGAPT